jgi:lipid A 3-O-deacylase
MTRRLLGALLAAALPAAPAAAGELFAGIYGHDLDDELSIGGFESGAQVIAGARTTALDELAFLGRPRVHLFAAVNTDGGTNYAAAGLSWRFNLSERWYVQPGAGLAIHDGKVGLPSPDEPGLTLEERQRRLRNQLTKLDLGSRVLFQPEVSLGFKATRRLSMELSWIHLSHAQLAGPQNPGLGDIGLRLLYRYGLDR